MARRQPYTKVERHGQLRPAHVRGQGDVLYRRFQCMSPICEGTLVARDDDCGDGFELVCPACGYRHYDGGSEIVFSYDVVHLATDDVLESGSFAPSHAAYLELAERAKYCLNCYALLPLAAFDRHSARETGRQGECRMCKRLYNDLKNHTRLVEQHREAADNRRLLRELSGETRLRALKEILTRFDQRCFNCDRSLIAEPGGDDGYHLDHTLPVAWLWPLDYGATVLCRLCNGQKADQWPAAFIRIQQSSALSRREQAFRTKCWRASRSSIRALSISSALIRIPSFSGGWRTQHVSTGCVTGFSLQPGMTHSLGPLLRLAVLSVWAE
jgi:hypothetical protein